MGNTQPVIGAVHVMDATDGRRSIKATQSYAGKLQIIGDHSAIIRNSDKVHGILNDAESKISSLGLRVRFTGRRMGAEAVNDPNANRGQNSQHSRIRHIMMLNRLIPKV